MDDKIFQEFYCGECSTYIRVRLNMSYNRTIWMECPMCKHRHQRYIENGQILERGRYEHGDPKEDICPPKSACSKEPITKVMQKNQWARDSAVIKSSEDLARDNYMRELWIELYGQGD